MNDRLREKFLKLGAMALIWFWCLLVAFGSGIFFHSLEWAFRGGYDFWGTF
jgi:hypothetical protein